MEHLQEPATPSAPPDSPMRAWQAVKNRVNLVKAFGGFAHEPEAETKVRRQLSGCPDSAGYLHGDACAMVICLCCFTLPPIPGTPLLAGCKKHPTDVPTSKVWVGLGPD